MIRLNHVNKFYNKRKSNEIHVINDTSIELADKGLVTFLGHSGCGKTTLLNAIGGLDRVDSGEIWIDGEQITTRRNNRKDELRNAYVGYIFQNYNLLEDATVFENVALVLRMMGVRDKAEIEERVMYILQRVGIDRYRNRPARMLSGGERQRVGIARAIVKNPKIIIADEPTGNLDSRNTIEIMNIIKAISREKLVILVTHERDIAEFYASRVIEIVDGAVVSDREQAHSGDLDYRLENKIYLQDLPTQTELSGEGVRIKYYSDQAEVPEIKVVVRNNNLYIQTPEGYSMGSDAVELVDDHYKKLSRDVYETYEFDSAAFADPSFRPRYTSIYKLPAMLAGGYRKIFSYSVIKKILLLGFVLASMFSLYAVSSIAGITNITDDKFVEVNQNYLGVTGGKLTPRTYRTYAQMEGIDYVLPGDSTINMELPLDDYYQTARLSAYMKGSLAAMDLVDPDAILAGRTGNGTHDLVIDKMTADQLFTDVTLQMAGVSGYEALVGREVQVPYLGRFTIVGVTSQNSPSIYADRTLLTDLLIACSGVGGDMDVEEEETVEGTGVQVLSYEWVRHDPDIEIVYGSAPENDYEALVDASYMETMGIGAELDERVNGHRLTICGYFSDRRQRDVRYVTAHTAQMGYLTQQNTLTLSPVDKSATYAALSSENVKVKDYYASSRKAYIDGIRGQVLATLLVSAIILFISLVEMYLMLRSSFLSRIREVGVLRAIGLKKRDVYKMFIGEIIAMTSLTTVPGMAVMGYILYGITKVPFIGSQYLMNPMVLLITFGIVFGFNLLAGLLPAIGTMRRTPAAILSRNDVN